jgi:hypothetical protein
MGLGIISVYLLFLPDFSDLGGCCFVGFVLLSNWGWDRGFLGLRFMGFGWVWVGVRLEKMMMVAGSDLVVEGDDCSVFVREGRRWQ